MKRTLILLLIASLLLCTACTPQQVSEKPDPISITIGYWNISSMNDVQQDAIRDYIEGKLGIQIMPVSVDWTSYKEYYQMLSTTDSLPDVFTTLTMSSTDANDNAFYQTLIEDGRIQPLPDDLSMYPNLKKMLEQTSYTAWEDGKYYAIPHTTTLNQDLSAADAVMVVRRDWMNRLGIEDPTNLQEFISMVSAFAHDDPDGNGIDDTIGYNVNSLSALGKWVILGIAPACNTYGWIEQDGRFIPSWYSSSFDDVVSAFYTLYHSGGLDQDFYIKNPKEVLVDFASGRLGALEYKSSPAALQDLKKHWDQYNTEPFEECVDVIPLLTAPDGTTWRNTSLPFWSEIFISSHVDAERLDRILRLIDFLLSEEGMWLVRYGLEGVDYRKNSDGSFTILNDISTGSLTDILQSKYPSLSLFASFASWGGSEEDFAMNEMNQARFGTACMTLTNKSITQMLENTEPVSRPEAFLIFPKEPSTLFSTSQAFQQFVQIIISDGEPVTAWHQVIAQMQADGIEAYIQRQNDLYQQFRTK